MKIAEDARAFTSTGLKFLGYGTLLAIPFGLLFLLVGQNHAHDVPDTMTMVTVKFLARIAAPFFLVPVLGSIRLGQGLLMRATGRRVDLTLRMALSGEEYALSCAYAVAWVLAVVGGLAVALLVV